MPSETLDRVRALAPAIAKRSEEFEQARRLPLDVVDDLTRAGAFRMFVPRRFGGDELSLVDGLEVISEIARVDGSAGWTVMIGASAPLIFSLFPVTTVEAIYQSGPDSIGGGVIAPKGRAVAVDGGYRVSGQWPFASGCQHCSYLAANAIVFDGDSPRLTATGAPEMRVFAVPAADVEIVDTWHVEGLRGTGSHDIRIDDRFVADEWSSAIFGARPTVETAVTRIPVVAQLGLFVSAVAVGIAQAAVDDAAALAAGGKKPAFGGKRLAESPVFQDRLGDADATVGAARALLHTVAGTAYEKALAGDDMALVDRARMRASAAKTTALAVEAVDAAYSLGGGSSLYDSSPLQRRLRDVRALTQHAAVSRDFYPMVGALLAGEEIDSWRV